MNANHIGGQDTTTLSVQDFPELKGLPAGTEVSGIWRGKITSTSGGSITIRYDDFVVEDTGNPADKELSRMRGDKEQDERAFHDEDEDYIDY